MPSIIPSPGAPSTAPNVTSEVVIDRHWTVLSGETLYTTSLSVLFGNYGLQTDYFNLVNDGEIWNISDGNASLIYAMNFGGIENNGLAVAQSSAGSAQTFVITSTWRDLSGSGRGLSNTGEIFAIAPNGSATAVGYWDSGAVITNSNLIAAQGRIATSILCNNSADITNTSSGQILAEGYDAVAIYVGRGNHPASGFDFVNIDNAGLIQAAATTSEVASAAILIASAPGETYVIHNTGTITGDFAVYADDYAFSPATGGREYIRNGSSGVINGHIFLGGADDVIVNEGRINGYVFFDLGDDSIDNSTGVLNGAAMLGWGADAYVGGASSDAVHGDRGADSMSGGGANDLLLGGRGDDFIVGGADNDGLYGEWGDDYLVTLEGDRAMGGDGDDTIQLGDLNVALADGGAGRDVLILPNTTLILDLQAALASGRIAGFEQITLPDAQELVVRPGDVAAITGGSELYVATSANGRVDLVGAWTAVGALVIDGVQYERYESGGASVLVSGAGAVAILAAPPPGAVGLDFVSGGAVAPLPGSLPGVVLTGSVTQVGEFGAEAPEEIDADEQWLSTVGSSVVANELTNYGLIQSIGPATGARGLVLGGDLRNFGEIRASASGNAADLAQNIAHLNTYGFERAAQTIVGNVYAIDNGTGLGSFYNAGLITASSEASAAVAFNNWLMLSAQNDGTISATSSMFVAFGVYAHNGGYFVNNGDILAEGDLGAVGFGASTHALTLINTGRIIANAQASSGESYGLALYYQGGQQTIINSGEITADVAIQTSQMVNQWGLFLDNSGEINGRIELNINGDLGRMDAIYNSGAINGEVRLGDERDIYYGPTGSQVGTVFGEGGNDIIIAGVGSQTLNGGDGHDLLQGGVDADTLTGGAGRDVFSYAAATDSTAAIFDTITDFQTGVDVIDLSALAPSSVTLSSAGGGATTLTVVSAGGTTVVRIAGAIAYTDLIVTRPPMVAGTASADLLVAAFGGILNGDAGDDVLVGSDGNDRLDGGDGEDLLWGGLGDDTYVTTGHGSIADAPGGGVMTTGGDTIRELPGGGIDTVEASPLYGYYYLPQHVENLTLVTGNNGIGNTLDNVIIGNANANTLDGGAGVDTLIGGAGGDLYYVDHGLDIVIENAGEGTDTVRATASYVLSANIEQLTLVEGAGAINGFGNGMANLIVGNESANVIEGRGGDDTIRGGFGADEINGGDGADYIDGQGHADLINGGSGADEIWGEGGADTLYGGDGDDQISGAAPLYFDMIAGQWRPTVDDDLAADQLFGGAGNDTLDGGAGADTMIGNFGNDSYYVDNVGDAVSEGNIAGGTDQVFASVSFNLAATGYADHLTLTGLAAINGTGNSLNNTITGNSAANVLSGNAGNDTLNAGDGADTLYGGDGVDVLDGGAGADVMIGNFGNDTYYVADAGDVVLEGNIAGGVDQVFASVTFNLGPTGYADHLTLTGAANIEGFGNVLGNTITGNSGANALWGNGGDDVLVAGDGNDSLYGGDGADSLDGGTGADTMIGNFGNDTYYVDNAGDVVSEGNVAGGTDTVFASLSFHLGPTGYADNLTLTGASAINATGNSLANTLTGNAAANVLTGNAGNDTLNAGDGNDTLYGGDGADTLDGGAGADTMIGNAGDDTYYVDNAGDTVSEGSNVGGNDIVYASVSFNLAPTGFAENLTLTGLDAINATGNNLANAITGNAAANTLTGAGGADSFVFASPLGGGNVDAIADFSIADDTIVLNNAVFTGLSAGALDAGAFVIGSAATDADDRIIYDSATGQLFFDADGAGGADQILFATLTAGLVLTNADFIVSGP